MKQPLIILLLILGSRACFGVAYKTELVIDVFSGGKLVKRHYFSKTAKVRAIVNFEKSAHGKTKPVDSILFLYDKIGSLNEISFYNYSGTGYTTIKSAELERFYFDLYGTSCEFPKSINYSIMLKEDLRDACVIEGAILANNNYASEMKRMYKQGSLDVCEFEGLNSRFRRLKLDVESQFYNKILKSFLFRTQKNCLRSVEYRFQNGIFKRFYYYRLGRLVKIKVMVNVDKKKIAATEYFRYRIVPVD